VRKKLIVILTALALLYGAAGAVGCGPATTNMQDFKAKLDAVVSASQDAGVEAWIYFEAPTQVGMFNGLQTNGRLNGIIRVNPGE